MRAGDNQGGGARGVGRQAEGRGLNPEPFLLRQAGQGFYNTSAARPEEAGGGPRQRARRTDAYVQGFSANVRDIFERFEFAPQIDRLAKATLLYLVTEKFASIDLHPDRVDNSQMGLVFEELIRKFAELSNETAGEHFTPREVIRLMVNLIFVEDDEVADQARRRAHGLRPHGRHGRHAVGAGRAPDRDMNPKAR